MLPQLLWIADLLTRLLFGTHITGMTSYMFDSRLPLFVRGLSLFHGWLPLVLLWLLMRLGYDRRALAAQSAFGVALLLVCFFLAPAPPPPLNHPGAAVNINYVYGFDDGRAQTWMAPGAWLSLLTTFIVVGLYLPAHFGLQRVFTKAAAPAMVAVGV